MDIGTKVRIKDLDVDTWNAAARVGLSGQTGTIERVKLDYGFDSRPHALVGFDPPLPAFDSFGGGQPVTGFWIDLKDLEVVS